MDSSFRGIQSSPCSTALFLFFYPKSPLLIIVKSYFSDQFSNRKLFVSLNEEAERKGIGDLGSFYYDHIYRTSPSIHLSKFPLYPVTLTVI